MKDTIAALSTPFGRSGIGIVRFSGNDCLKIVRQLTQDENFEPKPRFAHLKKIYDLDARDVIDETLVTYYKEPHSFTGEDVIEIACHGSPVVLRQIIDLGLKFDARLAEAGEFSLRALANGQINLSQAEAIRDLIDAQTIASAKQSVRQLRGEFSNQLQPLKDSLLDVIILLESAMEFVEDDLPDFQIEKIKSDLERIAEKIGQTASTFEAGKLLREGLKVALVGKPNVGKSSLFNALLGFDRAIVTSIAGTTRDQIHEKVSFENVPIYLIDTAGLRQTNDTVESIGVERSRLAMVDADLVILILDGSQPLDQQDFEIISQLKDLNYLVAVNKFDLAQVDFNLNLPTFFNISAKTRIGLNALQKAVIEPFVNSKVEQTGFLVSDARHFDLLIRSQTEIETSISLLDQSMSEEIVLIGLHNSLKYLGQITGETSTEDMLTRIFSTFCIGK